MAVRSAREAAYETIRSRIITMELKPGDELNDHALAQEMGISRTPMREALIMLNIAHMVTIKPQSGTYVAPIDLTLMEMEQFARYTLEKEILNHIRGRLTGEQERAYRLLIEQYRMLESDSGAENRETRMLELDNAFHRRAFELCGMEAHFDHMLSTFQHIERRRVPFECADRRPSGGLFCRDQGRENQAPTALGDPACFQVAWRRLQVPDARPEPWRARIFPWCFSMAAATRASATSTTSARRRPIVRW